MTSPSLPEKTLQVDKLRVEIYADREKMGVAAAHAVATRMKDIIADSGEVAMVFAAAPSQNEFLATLRSLDGIAWDKVVAFHMDEYIGLPADAPQSFGNFLRDHLFDQVSYIHQCIQIDHGTGGFLIGMGACHYAAQ